ncbi:exonuclease SbcCD subunit D C-terminal domain-containing protein [Nocardia zapadnayensis]|nr:exonuclease SbcCD subunit D [Nocardia zapadnayensis]MCX0277496.1 exonuclease SbcCD subunit D C-terminal domain-containing protein [Nocardia zapadnayensis]
MRILHTSDWHLGRSFFGVDQHDVHARFLDFLVDTVEAERIDVILVSGDVYDRAIPPQESLELFDTAVGRLLTAGTRVVVSSGNHDSFMRLGIGRRLVDTAGLHLRTRLSDITWPVPLSPAGGEPEAVVYAIPYLEPALVHSRFGVERTHTAVLGAAMERIREHAGAHHPGVPLLVMAHAFVSGAVGSESERDIGIGGVGVVPAAVFAGADYAALGHLHRPQSITPTVRYSGSPVPLSFTEALTPKQLVLLDIRDAGIELSAVPVPAFSRIETVRGTFADVLARAAEHEDALVAVELTDTERVDGALGRLRAVLPGLIRLSYVNAAQPTALEVPDAATAAARTDTEVFSAFVDDVAGRPARPGERTRFETALASSRREDA